MEYAEIDGDLLFVYYYSVWYFNKMYVISALMKISIQIFVLMNKTINKVFSYLMIFI